jgi:hypothetical protein
MNAYEFFEVLWDSYVEVTPQAASIQALFSQQGEQVINDHVAFRTFANSPIALAKLETMLIQMGYSAYGAFRFENKHLSARCYKHSDANLPKIFLSELLTHELSAQSQAIIDKLVQQIDADVVQSPTIFCQGRLWQAPSYDDYQTLAAESEYAAWLSTMGLKVNHFTVSINHLHNYPTIEAVNQRLLESGYELNRVGGLVKGSPAVYLEQSSTMADKIEFTFADGIVKSIPRCFYEFDRRHVQADGQLLDSFIEGNADKIFNSTNQANA